ncbi:MAG: glycosyltransferase [Armatimonadota bacterium]
MIPDARIRTLHILTSMNRRGAETFAIQLVDRLSRDTFLPSIWTVKPSDLRARYLVPENTVVLSQGPSVDEPSTLRRLRHLVAVLWAWQPHLVQCHGGNALKIGIMAKPFWRSCAYVYTKIGSVHPWLDPRLKRLIYTQFMERVDAIVAVGEQIRREVETVIGPKRPQLLTINTGRDVTPFTRVTPDLIEQKRRELDLDPSDLCLMTVGNLSWEKDPAFLLHVLKDLLPEHPRAKLVYVGEGSLEAELRRQAARDGIADHVRFAGLRSDVPHLLSAADVFLLPSTTEGLPGVLIEAGMAGAPAVSFRVGSVDDVLKDGKTGFVVPAGNRQEFIRRTAHLLRDAGLREQMGREALALCRRDFDIRLSVQRHEALFMELVEAVRRRSPAKSAFTTDQRDL